MWASIPLVHEHHELRTEGPYRIVRHPIYTGLLGLVLGGMLACGFGVWIVFLAVAVPWLLRRVRIEDGMMADRFGATYEAYRARVPALIPWTRPAPVGPRALDSRHGVVRGGRVGRAVDYLVLEAGDAAGTFFRTFPRHRQLISINKPHTGTDDPELNLRLDWNSLLTDDPALLFTGTPSATSRTPTTWCATWPTSPPRPG
jgi:hypothetical protein